MSRARACIVTVLTVLCMPGSFACAQESTIDGKRFSELSLRAISASAIGPKDRRGAQMLLAQQVALLPPATRIGAADVFLARLREGQTNRNDILAVLADTPWHWTTSEAESATQFVYQLLLQTTDSAQKVTTDNALANARGLYKQGIGLFNSTDLREIVRSEPMLKVMTEKYPKSRYAERASFYLGQYFTRRYVLKDEVGARLIEQSNAAFEEYIKRAQAGDFDRKDFLASGYFFRGLNGWLSNNLADAQKWLAEGRAKFTDTDVIYIYQLFVTPDKSTSIDQKIIDQLLPGPSVSGSSDKSTIIDQFLSARSVFIKTLDFLNRKPTPSVQQSGELASILRQ